MIWKSGRRKENPEPNDPRESSVARQPISSTDLITSSPAILASFGDTTNFLYYEPLDTNNGRRRQKKSD